MKHNRFCPFLYCIILSLILLFSGCNLSDREKSPSPNSLVIEFKDSISLAYVDTAYNLYSTIIVEEDVEYSFTASYLDPESGTTKNLTVKKGKITPKAEADILVAVTATKGTETSTAEIIVPISISADIIDKLLASDGIAGEADIDVRKAIEKDLNYLHSDNSSSSIEVTFTNPAVKDSGTNLMLLSHYSLHPYYSAQVWNNAAVSFWVYNPMAQEVTFKLSSCNPVNNKVLMWNSAENVYMQTAIPGQWTHIVFSLFDIQITQPLINSPDQVRDDFLKLLAYYEGEGSCTIYIDEVDIVHASTIQELTTSFISPDLPYGDFSDLLKSCKVYTDDSIAKLTASNKGNGSKDSYCFGAEQQAGYPTFHIDFPNTIDIRSFDYLKFDVYAENCYPFVSATIRYIDENGSTQKLGVSYDFKRDEWRTLYLNLHALKDANLSQVVGISFSIHMDSRFEAGRFNCIYFDNISLYTYQDYEPTMLPSIMEDSDILNAPLYVTNAKPNINGVCKVSTDETGAARSNSTVLFWANNVSGYPTATFLYDNEQDWSDYNVLTFETHQVNAHYWMHFEILYLDSDGKQHSLSMYYDTVFNHWLTTNAPFEWFKTEDGQSAKPEHLRQVIGLRITVDFANNVTDELSYIFFDNFELS